MDWIELEAATAGEHVEALYAALSDVAPGGCSIEEPLVPLGPEEGVRREPWRPTIVRFYLPADDALDARLETARRAVAGLSFKARLAERRVREADWAGAWKEFFHVEHIGRLVIRPTWREYQPAAGEVVLDLDPGMAFGTGQHETTRMCLHVVAELPVADGDVLDLGCGSGILGIAAAKLGARTVTALDVESAAVEAATANAERNGVASRLRVARGSLGMAWPFVEPAAGAFDTVLANIHAGAIQGLAPAIRAALRTGGVVVASGIIAERLAAVLDALDRAGFVEPAVRAEGEWRTVIARAGDRGRA